MSGDAPMLKRLPGLANASEAELLDRFLDYVTERGLELYPAQEEAILEVFADRNVILNTPTGSGKSLVAAAMHFKAMARGRRSVYTCPIKALVNEKFLALCRDFGPENVGLATGDASVNRGAPILCCTAEILAHHALQQGEDADFADVVMDEFHYYSDPERGVAWQVPLLTMARSRFLLMSATMGAVDFFQRELEKLTGAPTVVVASSVRPVPLEFSYVADAGLDATVQRLVAENKAPIYVVHFTQNDAAESAQALMSQNYCTAAEKAALAEALVDAKFTSPYGKEIKKFLRHGIGLHHAGLLPKYRVLVETLAQKGLLKIICGTDTLGVGVNVPIRTVLLTRLSKYSGSKTAVLSARDFHQITGRAGRKGFDDIGYVVALAPEHVIENAKLEAKVAADPKKKKKLVKRQPPPGFVGWNEDTFKKLQQASPEPLTSRFQVNHSMVLHVLSRDGDGCRALQRLIRASHESAAAKKKHRRRAWQLFRSLLPPKLIEIIPPAERAAAGGRKLRLNVALQEDFSLNHTLSLYLIETLPKLDPQSPTYPLEVMSLVEAILEDPDLILRRQLDKLKAEKLAELKAAGVSYEVRMAELEELEYPKPGRDFIYDTFNAFSAAHPWVGNENIRPKSIVREMYEEYESFAGYVHRYKLERSEGVLLRHLSSAYKVLAQTVPDSFKNEAVREMEDWLAGLLRGTDSSLLDEWERLKDPNYRPPDPEAQAPAPPPDITRRPREFTALIRSAIFHFLRPLAAGRWEAAAAALRGPDSGEEAASTPAWDAEALARAMEAYRAAGHERLLLDTDARNLRHTHITVSDNQNTWKVRQTLVDPDGLNDWQAVFTVDVPRARAEGQPTVMLQEIGPIGF